MKRAVAKFSPSLALAVAGLWLLLNETLAVGQVLLGAALGFALAGAASTLRPLQARIGRIDVAMVLFGVVLTDIVRSNLDVARLVLSRSSSRPLRSAFLQIPLELRDPHGLAALAAIITATPGTVWAGLSPSGDVLTIHVLDLEDEAELTASIKRRYEQPLMRIFE